jgi:uncharacterized protein
VSEEWPAHLRAAGYDPARDEEAVMLGNGSAAHTAIIAALVRAGAEANIADRQDMTALADARARGFDEMIRALEAAEPRPTRSR